MALTISLLRVFNVDVRSVALKNKNGAKLYLAL